MKRPRSHQHVKVTTTDPAATAQLAGLRYVSPGRPGLRRVRAGNGFKYLDQEGKPVRSHEVISRIKSLVIPPAWNDVWICSDANGHLQAVGRDARGRKQYRYHPRWRQVRDESKYTRLAAFGQALPHIRRRVARDLRRRGLSRDKVLAAVVRLLDTSCIRVGNAEYAAQNGAFGLTTLRVHHAEVNGSKIHLKFPGKSKIHHTVEVMDRRLARIVKQCQELPGQDLFEYVDESGRVSAVTSADVNDYLRALAGEDFTAKDFRTWAGTALAAEELLRLKAPASKTAGQRQLVRAIDAVAKRLGNTRAICRKCYVHPAVIDGFLDGTLAESLRSRPVKATHGPRLLKPEETSLLKFLKQDAGRHRAAAS